MFDNIPVRLDREDRLGDTGYHQGVHNPEQDREDKKEYDCRFDLFFYQRCNTDCGHTVTASLPGWPVWFRNHIANTSVLSIAIKNHSAPENLDQNQIPAPVSHFSDGRLLSDGNMLPTCYYKKSADRAKKGP
jgi:hypothetical protein